MLVKHSVDNYFARKKTVCRSLTSTGPSRLIAPSTPTAVNPPGADGSESSIDDSAKAGCETAAQRDDQVAVSRHRRRALARTWALCFSRRRWRSRQVHRRRRRAAVRTGTRTRRAPDGRPIRSRRGWSWRRGRSRGRRAATGRRRPCSTQWRLQAATVQSSRSAVWSADSARSASWLTAC